MQKFGRNLLWGLQWGMVFGIVYAVWAIVLRVVGGTRAFEKVGIGLPAVLAFYLLGGAFAGLLLGLCRPLLRWKAGSAATGSLIAIPLFVIMTQGLLEPPHAPSRVEVWIIGSIAIIGGAVGGLVLREVMSD